jgi:uncharacterized OsmC-like protein
MTEADQPDDLLPPSIDPAVKKLGIRRVTGLNDATTKTICKVRNHVAITDEPSGANEGPTPLETVLIGLVGCEGVIINRCAEAMGFRYSKVEIEADGEVDQRGSRGVAGVRPYFNWIKLKIRIKTPESVDRLHKLQRNVEYRCPVMNLMKSADVQVEARWVLTPE